MKGAGTIDIRPFLLKHAFHLAHGHEPVTTGIAFEPLPFRPIRGIDAGSPVECVNRQAAIVCQGHQTRSLRCRPRFQKRILDERGAGFCRFGQPEGARRDAFDTIRFEQRGNLLEFSRIMRGNHQRARTDAACHLRVASS